MATEPGLKGTVLSESPHFSEGADSRRDLRLQLLLLAFMLLWYGVFLLGSARHPNVNLTFNSMLDRLLHGQFDVDPGIVGNEGFLRNGRSYSYWGVWCALLRLPLWIFGRMNTDITAWSCLAAVCLAAMAKVRTVLLLRRFGAQDRIGKHAVDMMLGYIVLGGSEIGYLRTYIYQEVVFWAVAFASVFVYFAIKGLVNQRFDLSTLGAMSICSGLSLLTRVSTAVGLILAFGLLVLVLVWQSNPEIGGECGRGARKRLQVLLSRRMLIPLGILAVFAVIAGGVNYFRWGNPLTIANYRLYALARVNTDRIPRLDKYGLFNIRRIPFGLMYYFLPIWAVRTRSGDFLFEPAQARLFDAVELPPSSFFLTDLLPLSLVALLLFALWKHRAGVLPLVGQRAAIAFGLSIPGALMVAFFCLAYRYRMEFYPEIDFLAFQGLYMVLVDEKVRAIYVRLRVWMEAALIVSAAASLGTLFLYLEAPFGPAQEFLHRGMVHGKHFVWY
jgi:hypothetical protein